MTAADKLSELLATRPAEPTHLELVRWWRAGGELVAELLGDSACEPAPPGPLDEMAQNLMTELHAMKFEGAPIGMGLRLDRLLDKVHALAVVTADTRIREFVVTINGHTVTVHKDTHPAEFALLFDAFLGTLEGEP